MMKNIWMAVLVTGMLVFANSADALLFNGHNYEFIKFAGKSWDEAANDISTRLGPEYYLATITTQQEQDFIAGTLLHGLTGQYWLGASQLSNEKSKTENWNWFTGEAWNYSNWHAGEPNDNYGPASEQYLAMWKQGGWDWEWNDEGNLHNISGYIAEAVDPVPEPATVLLFGAGLLGLAGLRWRRKKK